MPERPTTRRSFLGVAGGAALLCSIGGEELLVDSPESLGRADAAAARVRRPRASAAQDVPQLQPQPGGVRREYWIQAQTQRWSIVPTRRDDWHNRKIPGKSTYRAYTYFEMTPGFAAPKHGPSIPGPTLFAEVGDVLVVHFRNADRTLRQAVTMHPHGVKYGPEYDGAYLGEYTRAGGFVAPGETFTYQWECTPDSVGSWPYHDHGPNHTLNTFRGLFGMVHIRPRGARAARRPPRAVRAPAAAAGHRPAAQLPVHQRARLRRQHADRALARRPARRADSVQHGQQLPHVPHPRPPLAGPRRGLRRQSVDGAERVGHGPLRRGQPGPLALSLSRLLASGHRDDGLVRRRPVEEERPIRTSLRIVSASALALALLAPAGANAQTYPEPKEPGKVEPRPKRPYETHTVCKKGRCDFRTIQAAVNAADAGDTIKVRRGVYREAVRVDGRKKRYLKLVGDPSRPGRVVLDGGNKKQNGIAVNDADEVSVSGFKARNYRANGFFFTNLTGYTMNHLVAQKTGVYGLYAFNTIGGRILNSEAYYVNDGAFYIGQTPPQDKPVRTVVRNIEGWGSPIGFSASNMRYVTITKSRFYNNAIGIVPNALDSEKFPPPEDNVIIDNEIFWNNFNFHEGKPPFTPPPPSATGNLVPLGTGILLLGGRDHRIENNRIYGNFLTGIAMIDGILLTENPPGRVARPQHRPRQRIRARRHRRQRPRRHLRRQRHRQLLHAGGVGHHVPGRSLDGGELLDRERERRRADADDRLDRPGRPQRLGRAPPPGQARLQAARGVQPVRGAVLIAGAALLCAAPAQAGEPQGRTVRIYDNYFLKDDLTVKRGTVVTWRWPGYDEAGDVHDIKLQSGPKGVKKFSSDAAATDYTFKRKLEVPGRYRIVCTMHDDMTMKIRVRR